MSLLQDFEVDLSEPIDDLVIPIQSNLQIQIPSHLNSSTRGFHVLLQFHSMGLMIM